MHLSSSTFVLSNSREPYYKISFGLSRFLAFPLPYSSVWLFQDKIQLKGSIVFYISFYGTDKSNLLLKKKVFVSIHLNCSFLFW